MTTHASMQSRRSRSDTWIETVVLALIAALAVAALLSGCLAEKEEVESGGGAVPTWTELQASLLSVSCSTSSCHQPTGSQAPSFAADQYSAILASSRNYVVVGDSASSLLYTKVAAGGSMAGYAGATGAQDIKDWIDNGAPE